MPKLFRKTAIVCAILCSPLLGISAAHDLTPYDFSQEAKMPKPDPEVRRLLRWQQMCSRYAALRDAAQDVLDVMAKLSEAGEVAINATDIGAEAVQERLNRLEQVLRD